MAIQHLLPQDISGYRFRLIGDMTIKQFASLGICIVLAVITYSFPLPFFFKYPLVLAFILLGIGMAFVPFQGRSLDVWLIAFIKSIYSPTQYFWKRTPASVENTETAISQPKNTQELVKPASNTPLEITQTKITTPTQTTHPQANTNPIIQKPDTQQIPITQNAPTPNTTDGQQKPILETSIPSQKIETNISPITEKPKPIVTSQTPPPIINLPIPFTPTSPNTLVGLTLTPSGHILDGVLVEIKKNNLTIRATKSNKLGQFMFVRPLDPGLYQILAEKEDYHFDPYSLELTGEVVKPLKIQAQ